MQAISLMYHDICDEANSSGFSGADAALYKIMVSDFIAHLDVISKNSNEKPRRVTELKDQQHSIFITFDDGGVSALRAADLLEKKGWYGHFFITTSKIDSTTFVSKSEIKELHRRGHVIGTHSDSHPLRMASLPTAQINSEWRISVERLTQITGEKITAASVPGGLYSKKVAKCAAENGIKYLFNSEPTTKIQKVADCLILGRFAVQNGMKDGEVSTIINGDIFPRLKRNLIWNFKKPLKKIGGESFLKIRKFLIEQKTNKKSLF